MRKGLTALLLAASLLALSGCAHLEIGTADDPPEFNWKKWGSAFASIGKIPPYDGTIAEATLFRGGEHTGELASFNIWPIGGMDVGILGARVRLFPFEAGAGTILYKPAPTLAVREYAGTETKE